VLDGLSVALAVLASRQGVEGEGINNDETRLVKGADEIFPFRGVDAGFSSSRAVDLGHDGGGDLNKGNTAEENSSNKASKITDDTATQGDGSCPARFISPQSSAACDIDLLASPARTVCTLAWIPASASKAIKRSA